MFAPTFVRSPSEKMLPDSVSAKAKCPNAATHELEIVARTSPRLARRRVGGNAAASLKAIKALSDWVDHEIAAPWLVRRI
jgi:hypothetical protein